MNSGHLANPVSQRLTVASGALLQRTLSSLATRGTATKKQNNHRNPKDTNEKQLFLKTRNENIRSAGQQCTPKAEEGYCNKATQSGPLTHSQSHQAQNTAEHTEVKQRKACTKEEIREVIWCYIYCKQNFAENYKTLYEIWRQRNPNCRMYMDAEKLMNKKNYIMKHNKITEMEIAEIKREVQTSQRSQPAEREQETLVHTGTIKDDEHKPKAVTTAGEETETQQNRDQINKLREKIESTYYQVTQITMENTPRLTKLQNMFKLKVIMKTANVAMGKILDEKDLNITEQNHLIYAAATVITEEINGMGKYRPQTQISTTPPWVRRKQGSINNIRKELSVLVEIQRDNKKVTKIKRTRLLKKYNIEAKQSLYQLTEELKEKMSAKTRRLSRYRKSQTQYYQNKLFTTDCK